MTIGLVLTALGLGLRHGVDWDHIAAIADLSSTAESRRRGFILSFLYASGHAFVVIVLGVLAIAFGSTLPEGVESWMGRIVGVTFIVLGAWILLELARKRRDFRLRSRWILILDGTFAGLRRVRGARSGRRVRIEHTHEHEHEDAPADTPATTGANGHGSADVQAHDHPHGGDGTSTRVDGFEPVTVGSGQRARRPRRRGVARSVPNSYLHSHSHSHDLTLAGEKPGRAGNGTATGIGLLHGIGVESPTQIAVFVASTSVAGVGAGVVLLLAWVLGLLIANSLLAGLAAFGLLEAERNFAIYVSVAVFVAVASLVMGAFLLTAPMI